jgi:hypothetical protein
LNTYNFSSRNALAQNSSGGKLLKWKVGNKFIKTSTFQDNIGFSPVFLYESYAEVIAYYIGKWVGLNCLKYNLCKVIINNQFTTIACESKDFATNQSKFISIGKLMGAKQLNLDYGISLNNYNNLINQIKVNGFKQYLDNMIILDYLILNDDRHFGNFGLLAKANNEWEIPPIFDNGNSMLSNKYVNNLKYHSNIDKNIKCKPFSMYYDYQIKLINTKLQKEQIERIKHNLPRLLLKMIREYSLPEERATFIKELIFDRIIKIQQL